MEALEARTQTDLLQLEENQSQLAHAYKISQTNHVPSEVRTEPSTLSSSVTGAASAYFTPNDINITNLTTENAELRKQLENLTRQNQTHQHIEILSPNKTQFNARTARTSPSTLKHQRYIPKITFTSSTCPCPFKPNTIRMPSQPK
jgi:hypothetical protein